MTRKELLGMIADELGHEPEDVTPETFLVPALGWEYPDQVVVGALLEEALDVSITDDALESCQTVGDILALPAVASRLKG